MNEKRFWFGVLLSLAWVLTVAWVLIRDPKLALAMTPNEWGDFFSGCSAPLAFLWLVLGYLQQGEELRHSTQALHLQAEELRNSVRQQRELVEVTRQQVDGEREALHLERLARREALKPQFVIKQRGGSFSQNREVYEVQLSNAGNTATNVSMIATVAGTEYRILDVAMVARTSEVRGALTLNHPFPEDWTSMRIDYLDAEGAPGTAYYQIEKEQNSPHSALRFTQIGADPSVERGASKAADHHA